MEPRRHYVSQYPSERNRVEHPNVSENVDSEGRLGPDDAGETRLYVDHTLKV